MRVGSGKGYEKDMQIGARQKASSPHFKRDQWIWKEASTLYLYLQKNVP